MCAFTWTNKKPIKPGWYLAVDMDCSSNPFLARIDIVDGELYVSHGWMQGALRKLKGYMWSSCEIVGPSVK